MQTFIDTETQKVYAFEDDVTPVLFERVYSFKTKAGHTLAKLPTTLQPYTVPTPTAEQVADEAQAALETSINIAAQKLLNSTAVSKGYDNILSACSYAAQAVGAPFQAEGQAFTNWRSNVWTAVHNALKQIKAGTLKNATAPSVIATLPAFVEPVIPTTVLLNPASTIAS